MTVGIALVGLGDIGMGAHLPALRADPRAQLRLVADLDPVRRAAARRELPDVAVVEDLGAVLADPGVDAIVLATPPWATTDLARTALASGRYVLAEKPIAMSTPAATGLTAMRADEVRRLQVGLTYRHDPAMGRLKRWIDEGRIGTPILARAHIYDERWDSADPAHFGRMLNTLEHGTPVLHEGAHVFDWFRFLFGSDPSRIEDAWEIRTDPSFPAANLTGARLVWPNGSQALVEFGWLTPQLPRCEITLVGPGGIATLDGRNFHLTFHTASGLETFEPAGDRYTRCFALQLSRFLDLVEGHASTPAPNLADGIAALSLSERVAHDARGADA